MEQIIEITKIECPYGYKAVYNVHTERIEIVPIDIRARVNSVEDAMKISEKLRINSSINSINALHTLQTVLNVLNEGHKFDLIEGKVWYPWAKFYVKENIPKDATAIKDFCYKGKVYSLISVLPFGRDNGLGCLYSSGSCSLINSFLACKDMETALYISEHFAQLLFEACFMRHFEYNDFEWL